MADFPNVFDDSACRARPAGGGARGLVQNPALTSMSRRGDCYDRPPVRGTGTRGALLRPAKDEGPRRWRRGARGSAPERRQSARLASLKATNTVTP